MTERRLQTVGFLNELHLKGKACYLERSACVFSSNEKLYRFSQAYLCIKYLAQINPANRNDF